MIDALRYACEGARRAIKTKKAEDKKDVHNQFNHAHGWMG
jgi:phage terminase large subunit